MNSAAPWRLRVLLSLLIGCTLVFIEAASVAGASKSPWIDVAGGSLAVGIDAAPNSCNPDTLVGDDWADRLVLSNVLPSAFETSAAGIPVYNPALISQAEVQSIAPQTVVYSINPKAVWSDGTPVRARDFLATWEEERGQGGAIFAPGSSTPANPGSNDSTTTTTTYAALRTAGPTPAPTATVEDTVPGATAPTGPSFGYRQIASMTASNHGLTVTAVYRTPYADWQSLFDFLLPASVLAAKGWEPSCSGPTAAYDLSAGPYVLHSVTPDGIVLDKNPRWWSTPPSLERITLKIAANANQLAHWLATGVVQVALPQGYSWSYLAATARPGMDTQTSLSSTLLQLEFSTTTTVTASVSARDGLAHLLDRSALVAKVASWAESTIAVAQSHLYPQGSKSYPGPIPLPNQVQTQVTYVPSPTATPAPTPPYPVVADPLLAQRTLLAAGDTQLATGAWTNASGAPVAIRLAVDSADPWAVATAVLIDQQWESAGIAVSLMDEQTAQQAGVDLASGRANVALLALRTSPYTSQAISWFTPLLGQSGTNGSQDFSGLDDPSISALLVHASEELNPVNAEPIYAQADSALWAAMTSLPLFDEPSTTGWSATIAGVVPNANGPSLMWNAATWSHRGPVTSTNKP